MAFAIWNDLVIGPGLRDYTVNGNAKTIATTVTNIMSLIDDLRADLQTEVASARVGIDSSGFLTIDSGGGAAMAINWTDANLGLLLGYTGNLAAATSHPAPRRVRPAFYGVHGNGPLPPSLEFFDPKPYLPHVSQTIALSGKGRGTRSGTKKKRTRLRIGCIDNTARLVSQSGAVATTYANAASTEDGLTLYKHALDFWWDSTDPSCQGWSDGRGIRYFETAPSFSPSGAPVLLSAYPHTRWFVEGADILANPPFEDQEERRRQYSLELQLHELT